MAMIGAPTATVSPGCASSSPTVPAHGDGSSTAALAVSISTRIWFTATASPGATCQVRMSASVSPSPASGMANSRRMADHQASERSTASSTRSRSGR